MSVNCWEIKHCCREAGARNGAERASCPAEHRAEFDGINGGVNGGRVCWFVAGTLCGGKKQGSFADKQLTCLVCDFYLRVKREEGARFRVKPCRVPHRS